MRGRRDGGNVRNVGNVFRTFLTFLRRVAGMPDYNAHLEHLRRCHPERPLPSQRQFYEEFIRSRYADGPTRCC
jgi:uncharacterized short protein YbdD (DUF466 family)